MLTLGFMGVEVAAGVLMHSLAHLLITAVSLECGYPSSAIRERIYCSMPGDLMPMAAILHIQSKRIAGR